MFKEMKFGAIGASSFKAKMAMAAADGGGTYGSTRFADPMRDVVQKMAEAGGTYGATNVTEDNDGTPGDITDDTDTQTTGAIADPDQQDATFI